MNFGGSDAIHSKRQHKVSYREVYAAELAIPSFLSWSDSPITFDLFTPKFGEKNVGTQNFQSRTNQRSIA